MATLVFSTIGTLAGGPLGGVIGALAGRQIDAAIIGSPKRHGPRLKELSVTTSSYGTILPRHYGRMRVPGSIIWATELVEQGETQGGGKGSPSLTTYTYSASFAVALSSRPIRDIGRIWADGNLLRGTAGDLKINGTMRIYTGEGDQEPDPLIAALEGADRTPAYRGLAYVVFEDLELANFYNRIPALTFEVFADEAFTLQDIVGAAIAGTDANVPLEGIEGLSCESSTADTLAQLEPMFPLDVDAGGETLVIARERLQGNAIVLSEPAISVGDGDFGGAMGYARRRSPEDRNPPEVLRYYDVERDYLPGLQRATGRPAAGQPRTVELPAAMSAGSARRLVERTARRADWSRDYIVWRTTELDPAVGPGSLVELPGRAGLWRVRQWEWRDTGIELSLERVPPAGADTAPTVNIDEGRFNQPEDLPTPATSIRAFELPWDGAGDGNSPALFAAVSSSESNWSGAALYADPGDGSLEPLGPSGRHRAVMGTTVGTLAAGSPLLFDRETNVTVALIGKDMMLRDATPRQLADGANKALIGAEIIQFASAAPLGDGHWRLANLLRGRGGTEAAIPAHAPDEDFVLLDARPIGLDAGIVGHSPEAQIVAVGRGDEAPVVTGIAMRNITTRPLSPVHPQVSRASDGSLSISWTRRARGAWMWRDGAETPLNEQAERYHVSFGPIDSPLGGWILDAPYLALSAQEVASLSAMLPGGKLHVRQQGDHGLSQPLFLLTL